MAEVQLGTLIDMVTEGKITGKFEMNAELDVSQLYTTDQVQQPKRYCVTLCAQDPRRTLQPSNNLYS